MLKVVLHRAGRLRRNLEGAEEPLETELAKREVVLDVVVKRPAAVAWRRWVATGDRDVHETQRLIPWRRLELARQTAHVARVVCCGETKGATTSLQSLRYALAMIGAPARRLVAVAEELDLRAAPIALLL